MLPYIFSIIINTVIGLFALTRAGNPAARAVGILVLCLGLWQTELFLLKTMPMGEQLDRLFHLTRIGMFMIPPALAFLTWRVCDSKSDRFLHGVIMPSLAIAVVLSLLNNTLVPSVLVPQGVGHLPEPDALYYVYFVDLLFALFASAVYSFHSFKTGTYRIRLRIKWLLVTQVFAIVVGGSIAGAYILGQDVLMLSVATSLGNAVFLGILLYSVINHHLADIGTATSRVVSHLFVASVGIGFFFGMTRLIESHWGVQAGGPALFLVQSAFLLLLLEIYPHLLRVVNPGTRRLFLNVQYDVQKISDDIRRALKRCVDETDLQNTLDHILVKSMQLGGYSLWVAPDKTPQGEPVLMRALGVYEQHRIYDADFEAAVDLPPGQGIVLQDEAPECVAEQMAKENAIACCPIHVGADLVGVLYVSARTARGEEHLRLDDIRILINLTRELSPTLARINLSMAVQHDLDNARKTLSLIDLMNHYHHEIKAPLAIIDGILSNDIYPAEKQRDIILRQVERGTELISLMGDVLRGDRKRESRRLDLLPLIRQCVGLFERDINHVEFHSPKIPPVLGDKSDLSILFINLLKNAVESRREGQPLSISVRLTDIEDSVQVVIQDNASGISESDLKHLWRGGFTTKPGGQGIGLQAVARIAREHGAEIDVDSVKGKGTTFTILFPRSGPMGLVNESEATPEHRPDVEVH